MRLAHHSRSRQQNALSAIRRRHAPVCVQLNPQYFAFMRCSPNADPGNTMRRRWLACLNSRKYVEKRRRGMGDGRKVVVAKIRRSRRRGGCVGEMGAAGRAVVLCCTVRQERLGRHPEASRSGLERLHEFDRHRGVRGAPGTRHLSPTAKERGSETSPIYRSLSIHSRESYTI